VNQTKLEKTVIFCVFSDLRLSPKLTTLRLGCRAVRIELSASHVFSRASYRVLD